MTLGILNIDAGMYWDHNVRFKYCCLAVVTMDLAVNITPKQIFPFSPSASLAHIT